MDSLIILDRADIYASATTRIPVLHDVNLVLKPAELVYVVGRVGSGKSSLLKTLYGELTLRAGNGLVCGYDLRRMSRKNLHLFRRNIGVVFQEYNLIRGMTVYQNLEFVLRSLEWKSAAQINARIEQVLRMVNLMDKAYKLPSHISGGERQRVCIARALLVSPQLLIADEPTGNLDPVAASEIISLFHSVSAQSGCSVILSTHNSENLRLHPSRVIRCADGFVVE